MPGTDNGYLSAEIHQASGMVAAQLRCDPAEALARTRIRSDASGLTLDEMARAVLARSVRFSYSLPSSPRLRLAPAYYAAANLFAVVAVRVQPITNLWAG